MNRGIRFWPGPGPAPATGQEKPAKEKQALPTQVGSKVSDFDAMRKRRAIRALVVFNKTNYFIDKGTPLPRPGELAGEDRVAVPRPPAVPAARVRERTPSAGNAGSPAPLSKTIGP